MFFFLPSTQFSLRFLAENWAILISYPKIIHAYAVGILTSRAVHVLKFAWHHIFLSVKKCLYPFPASHDFCCLLCHLLIFTFPLRVFKWTFTFEMWFISSWTNQFKPHPHTRHLSGLTSSPSNNVACLLTFAWRWTCIPMTISAEILRFGYSKPYVMSDLIQNIWKTSQVRWKLKIDTWLII